MNFKSKRFRQKSKIIFLKIFEKIKQLKHLERKRVVILAGGFLILVLWMGNSYFLPWFQKYQLRTHFYKATKELKAVSEEQALKSSEGRCEQLRKSATKLYSVNEIKNEIDKSGRDEKIKLVGKRDSNSREQDTDYLILNIEKKEVELFCFDFMNRLIVEGEGQLEIGFSNFENIEGNALSLKNGKGKIHHNQIRNSTKAGIFANKGEWNIYGNIIKDNLSYGIYGGYESSLNLYENAIENNGGYEVRLLEERQIFD